MNAKAEKTTLSKRFVTSVLTILVMVALLIPAGCNGGEEKGVSEVKIGVIYPLTGSLASTGKDLQNAISLAVEIVNGEYDLDMPLARTAGLPGLDGAKLQVVLGDHAGDPEKGATEAERLLNTEKVVAMVGCYNSSVTNRASQVSEAAGIPFLNPESTSPLLKERGFKWFFRTTADDAIFVQNFFDFLADLEAQQGIKVGSLGIVYENSLFGTGVGNTENQLAREVGLSVKADIPYAADTSSVDSQVQQLVAANPNVVMQTSYVQDAVLFMQTYKSLGYRPQAILAMNAGFLSPQFVESLGDDANYVLSRDVWALDLAGVRPLIKQVNDLYRQRYDADMTGNSARAFTGLIVLADAINRAGSTEPEAIRQALLATDLSGEQLIMPWDGIKFDPATGQNVLARGIIVQMQDRSYHTVWPWELADRDLVWPMPAWEK